MPSTLAALYEHNLWANQQMIDACAKLSDEQLDATAIGTYGTIRDTLKHLFGAEERYVRLLTNQGPAPIIRENEPFPSFEEMRALCDQSGQALIEIAEVADGTEVLRGKRRNGEQYEFAITVVLTQAINHATEHRAHINTTLTHLGVEPPDLDGWSYGDAHGQIKTWA